MAVTANNRIFYACQVVGFKAMGAASTAYKIAHGVQSVGITTNFNLEQAFELGQIQIYENIEGTPDLEVTVEKVLDGYPLLYHLASPKAGSPGLVGRSKERCIVSLGIWSDGYDFVGGQGSLNDNNPQVQIEMSGMYLSSVSYNIPVDGMGTESISLVGNHKNWLRNEDCDLDPSSDSFGSDGPKASGIGGVVRRENVNLAKSILPGDIHGISGLAEGNADDGGTPRVHLQGISISTDFSREDILELGRKAPYYRATSFPIEVTSEIEMIATSGDFVGAYEHGDPDLFSDTDLKTTASGNNTAERTIVISLDQAISFDLGTKNRLSSVSYGGGDATGGNVSISYSYTNFNDLTVIHSGDPALHDNGGTMNYTASQSGYVPNWGDTYMPTS